MAVARDELGVERGPVSVLRETKEEFTAIDFAGTVDAITARLHAEVSPAHGFEVWRTQRLLRYLSMEFGAI